MECRLLDQNVVSIICSPNKQFYCMSVVDSSDGEFLCDPNADGRIDQISDGCVDSSYDTLRVLYSSGLPEELSKSQVSKSASVESVVCTPGNSGSSIGDSSAEASLAYSDLCSDSLSTGSEAVFDGDATVRQDSWISSDSPSYSGNDVADATEQFSPVYAQELLRRSEGSLFTEKSNRSQRKCFRKYKSVQNNSSNSAGKRRTFSENSSRSDLKCSGVWKSVLLTDNLTKDAERNWKSLDSARYVGSSLDENGFLTSDSTKMTSKGHESANIDQAWDEYQVPLYEGISDDSSEEKLDASCLQGDWQHLTDEFNISDFGNNTVQHKKKHQSVDQCSDTDVEELHFFLTKSNKALCLIKASLATCTGSKDLKEFLATCDTNINCLEDLLAAVDQNDWDVCDVNQLSELSKQWEDIRSQLHRLTSCQDLSIVKSTSDVIIDFSPNDDVPVCKETSICPTEIYVNVPESISSSKHHSVNNGLFIPKRLNIFGSKLYGLLDESSLALQSALVSMQPLFIVLFILLVAYLFVFRRCVTSVMDIRFEPQLRYVIGPPPI